MCHTERVDTSELSTPFAHGSSADGVSGVRRRTFSRPLVAMVVVYQKASEGRPSPCRHVPSCSTYAIEALQAHGALRGGWLAVWRVLRCNPLGSHGYDPVPSPRSSRSRHEATRDSFDPLSSTWNSPKPPSPTPPTEPDPEVS